MASPAATPSAAADNRDACAICQEDEGAMVRTPCQHVYHLDCLKEIVRPHCPSCRADIRAFLISSGLTASEIDRRVTDDGMRICYEEMKEVEPADINSADFVRLCVVGIQQESTWVSVYRDVLLDQISNASRLFSQISFLKHQREPGVFLYMIDAVEYARAQHSGGGNGGGIRRSWGPMSTFAEMGGGIGDAARGLCGRVANPAKDFGVVALYTHPDGEMSATARLMSTDPAVNATHVRRCVGGGYISGVRKSRIAHRDILVSLLKCRSCRCSGVAINDPNPEYKFAKDYLKKMTTAKHKQSK